MIADKRKKKARRKKSRRKHMGEAEAMLEAQRRADAKEDVQRRNRQGRSVRDLARGSIRVVSGGLPTLGKRR
jgi:hypothetical protein